MKMMRFLMTIFAFFVGTGIALAVPITTLFNTGVNNDGTVRTNGQTELNYSIVSGPVTGAPFVRTSAGGFPIGPWLPDNSTSAWLAPTTGSSNPAGIYTYRSTFDLTGFDSTSASLAGQWSTDNNGMDILINGTSTGFTTGFSSFAVGFSPFSISSGFVTGINTLDFVVNDGGVIGGLRVELAGTANLSSPAPVPEPSTMILLGSGLIGLVGFNYRRNKEIT